MMTPSKIVVYALCLASLTNCAKAGERRKRELRFPKGASLVTAVALASILPKGPTDGLAHVLEFDLGFPFPEKFSIGKEQIQKKTWKNPGKTKFQNWYETKVKPGKRRRTKRNLKETQRKEILLKLEDAITRMGFNGFSCVSRFRCELRDISPQKSLLERLLVTLFKPASERVEEECQTHRKKCQISLLQIIMHSEQISSSQMV